MFPPETMLLRGRLRPSVRCVLAAAVALAVWNLAPTLRAEESDVEARPLPPRNLLLFDGALSGSDPIIGGTYRHTIAPGVNLGVFLSFAMRPQTKTITEQVAPHFFYQREEQRYLGALGLDLVYPSRSLVGVFASAGVGYSEGIYEGTRASPESGFTPLLRGGLQVKGKLGAGSWGVLRLGYQYVDLKTSDPNCAYLSVGVEF